MGLSSSAILCGLSFSYQETRWNGDFGGLLLMRAVLEGTSFFSFVKRSIAFY